MTVCVAAIFDEGIFGASDRMLTSGNIQFQPPQPKIWKITNSIVAMIAGDVSIQAEIFSEVNPVIGDRIKQEPNNWWAVKDIADIYCKYHVQLRSKIATRHYLSPLGLDANTFITRQNEMNPEVVKKITTGLIDYKLPDIEAIFAGIDSLGLHLYVVRNGNISCEDRIGFAAIGVGSWHAESLFMAAGHTHAATTSRALYLTFAAKKRAEIAPGVGIETDMFIIGPQLGSYTSISESIIQDLGKFYKGSVAKRKKIDADVDNKVKTYVDGLAAAKTQPVQEVTETKITSDETNAGKTPEK